MIVFKNKYFEAKTSALKSHLVLILVKESQHLKEWRNTLPQRVHEEPVDLDLEGIA